MNRKIYSNAGLLFLVVAFILFTLANNLMFNSVRVDLTENQLYTLSNGSQRIVESIDEPINLYFFFSDKASEDLTALRAYARRVQEMLEEYELLAGGGINLKVIDPEPFSDAEDQAAEFGLQSIPVNSAGDELYFGLAGTNALDDQEVIAFFQPDKEEFLEYEISKLIHSLITVEKPRVAVLSSIKVDGDINMQTFQTTPAWIFYSQLEQLFEVEQVAADATALPEDIDVLLLIHPKELSDQLTYAVDQFALSGGRLLVFVDPLAEMDRPATNPMMPSAPAAQSSDLAVLFNKWGISLRQGVVLGDSQTALSVGTGSGGAPVRHLGILGLEADNFAEGDVTTATLENINVATAGILDVLPDVPGINIEPLLFSSPYAMPLETYQFQFLSNPADLQKGFAPTGEVYNIAVRISGSAETAFPEGAPQVVEGETEEGAAAEEPKPAVQSTDNLNVVVVADTDMLTDRLWVQVQNFFGQTIASPWANNGDFIVNTVDNLSGSSELISVRSRGRFTRPFDVVQDLRRQAEARYLESANELQAQLAETESQLSELQQSRSEQNLLMLSPEQEAALVRFQDEKLKIRKQLRDVRHQLDKDIEDLGSLLKFMNIVLFPLVLTLLLLFLHLARGRQLHGREVSDD